MSRYVRHVIDQLLGGDGTSGLWRNRSVTGEKEKLLTQAAMIEDGQPLVASLETALGALASMSRIRCRSVIFPPVARSRT